MSDLESDEECMYEDCVSNESGVDDEDDDDGDDGLIDQDSNMIKVEGEDGEDEYPIRILTTEQIMSHMLDTIKEVNNVVQVIFSL